MLLLRREYGDECQYFRGVEVQDRGALHDHVMVWSPVAMSEKSLRALAIRAGFGHEVKLEAVDPGSRKAAMYVSKYVTKSADQRESVPWWGDIVDEQTGELTEGLVAATYRTWSQSAVWGTSMAAVRAAGAAYARALAELAEKGSVDVLVAILGAVPLPVADESPPDARIAASCAP